MEYILPKSHFKYLTERCILAKWSTGVTIIGRLLNVGFTLLILRIICKPNEWPYLSCTLNIKRDEKTHLDNIKSITNDSNHFLNVSYYPYNTIDTC